MEEITLKEEMYSHIEQWKTSGLTKLAYSQRQGFSAKKFSYWQKKYDKEHASTGKADTFLPISVKPNHKLSSFHQAPPEFQIIYPNGVRLECDSQDLSQLRSLLTLLD